MNIDERDERLIRICDDIEQGEILLQPDFQRGEVWSSSKKKLLIDTVLRKWHIPPVHVVVMTDGSYEVLDGQQRLTAIRDFVENKYTIDGNIQPKDDFIQALHGKRYRDLDSVVKREFDRYTLKINEINNYNPGEPSELFHRLNQTVKLTSSEARNAIYGSVRNSISLLVDKMDEVEVNKDILGFSNSRMSYNDLLSRIIVFLETDTLRAKVSESILNSRYRDDEKVNEEIIESIEYSIDCLSAFNKAKGQYEYLPSLTKASSLNWIYNFCLLYLEYEDVELDKIARSFFALEVGRSAVKSNESIPSWVIEHFSFSEATLRELLLIYIERSSSRVMSIGSILARDLIQSISCSQARVELPLEREDQITLLSVIEELREGVEPKYVVESKLDCWKANER
ncbi:DUF262 domain-containing protein [Vibrio harveyi]|uniref:DUF262 domain-containing protein n=1 Tax=Vibrio harveyi TaxID=669 RepID=UPI000A176BC3|nr:DUF262 domain-containing protein [Vibrio harveyi]